MLKKRLVFRPFFCVQIYRSMEQFLAHITRVSPCSEVLKKAQKLVEFPDIFATSPYAYSLLKKGSK